MERKDAKKNLEELRDSLSKILGSPEKEAPSKDDAIEFRDSARDDKSSFFQKFLEKAQKVPVVETFSNLGVAGSVAVTSAGITQVDLAKDTTEIFVAEIARDVIEEKVHAPDFVTDFVDFEEIHDWGTIVIAERFIEAEKYMESTSEEIKNVASDIKTSSVAPSKSEPPSEKTPDIPEEKPLEQKPEKVVQEKQDTEVKEEKPSEETKEPEPEKEVKEETEKVSEEPKDSDEIKETEEESKPIVEESKPVKIDDIPKVETPIQDTVNPSPY